MVRDGRILLIDVAFAELRPTPWRQAVDLANIMLCLALRSSAQEVYDRALRQFTIDEVSEAFAAARGLALPSQLHRALRAEGRDLHGEFLRLLPERPTPIKVQRWTLRRVVSALIAAILLVLLVLNAAQLSGIHENTRSPVDVEAACDAMEPMWLQAQVRDDATQLAQPRPRGCRRSECAGQSSDRVRLARRSCPRARRSLTRTPATRPALLTSAESSRR